MRQARMFFFAASKARALQVRLVFTDGGQYKGGSSRGVAREPAPGAARRGIDERARSPRRSLAARTCISKLHPSRCITSRFAGSATHALADALPGSIQCNVSVH